ncbi:hypothetical protein ACFYWX_24410 [Streptomyces sp. NPDC002888]|uniref:hypothetical protein n=1 Tax=Streptomyces sp. NPDC002888 TaxID=3364668 RepID=UPI0036746ADF
MRGHRPLRKENAIRRPRPRTYTPTAAEAAAWADVLIHHQLLHAAVLAPNGQWLVQDTPETRVRLLDGPAAMLDLAAEIQHRLRATRNRTR